MSLEVRSFIDEITGKLREIEIGSAETWWNLALTGEEKYQKKIVEWQMKNHALFHDREGFEKAKSLRTNSPADPVLAREVELIYKAFLSCQEDEKIAEEVATLEAELEGDYAGFRGEIDGKKVSNNEIKEILKTSTSSEKSKSAWEASKAIGPEVCGKVIKLAKLRNGIAKALGFRDYYAYSLDLQEIDETELFSILDRLDMLTREPFAKLKAVVDSKLAAKFGIAVEEIRPWHYHDPFFQEAPPLFDTDFDAYFKSADIEALTVETFDRVGMDIRPVLSTSDLYERENKNQHAFCLMVGREKDVRVLCNVRKNHNWMGTMLHEFGHAVYDWYQDRELPYLLIGPAHTNSTEAIAMLFGRLNSDADWLREVMGMDADEAEKLRIEIGAQLRLSMLTFVRWMLVMTNFERAMYADPDADLNKLWWDLAEKHQMLTGPEDRDMPDWSTKLHIALAPVYYHNYMLGEMTASQLQSHIENKIGGGRPLIGVPEGGKFLIDKLFREGKKRQWNEALEFCTGEKLKPEYFVEQYVKGD